MRPLDAEPSASPGQICLIAECASVQPEANAACTRRPRSGTPGTPVLQDLLHGSRLGARCLGRDHRGGCGFGRRLSGQHGLRPAGAGPVHHRHHVAVAKLASGADAGAHRARNHDDGHCRRLSRLRVAGGMGLWPGRSFDPRRLGALSGALRRGDRLARGSWHIGRRLVERAFQRWLAPALGEPDHRPGQHHPDFLADRPRLRHSGIDGSRGSAIAGSRPISAGRPRRSFWRRPRRRRAKPASTWRCGR